jgi:hypothetical protein
MYKLLKKYKYLDIIIFILLFILFILLIIYLLKYNKNILLYNNIETYDNSSSIGKLNNIPNILDSNILTIDKIPTISNINGNEITGNEKDKNIKVFPSLFRFPYKNYIGNFHFYEANNDSEIPIFSLINIRLLCTNFNTNNNYLFYVTTKTINYSNKTIYDLIAMNFINGDMISIDSNNDLKNIIISIDDNKNIVYNNNTFFDVYPINNMELNGSIETNQDNLVKIVSNKNGKYTINFEQKTIAVNNYRNTIIKTNDGLYKNLNIIF